MGDFPRITSLKIDGFKVFDNFEAKLGPLEVIAGANGSGKSSLFEFLYFIRKGMEGIIPPEIIPGAIGQEIFHRPGTDEISWNLTIDIEQKYLNEYWGKIQGPKGNPPIVEEGYARLSSSTTRVDSHFKDKSNPYPRKELMLRRFINQKDGDGYQLNKFFSGIKVYSSFKISGQRIRRAAVVEQEPVLFSDGGNLSAILHYFITEYSSLFQELQNLLALVVPGFQSLSVKARGGPGEVMAFWREEGVEADLTLADLSDGILRFLCWAVLCLHPKPPTLICIDEPELGLHPRVLPLLAGLFQKASQRTQVLIATHSSYFLSQFPLESIAVMRKEDGRAVWKKPADSQTLKDILTDFGNDEIAHLHISDELEHFSDELERPA